MRLGEHCCRARSHVGARAAIPNCACPETDGAIGTAIGLSESAAERISSWEEGACRGTAPAQPRVLREQD